MLMVDPTVRLPIVRAAPGAVVLLLAALPFGATAQTPGAGSGTDANVAAPPALHYVLQRGFHIVKSFAAVSSLTGWVMQAPDGQYGVFYSTSDGQNLIAGRLMAGSGEDLTQRYVAQYVPQPDFAALWTKFENAAFVVTGAQHSRSGVLYAIMDPNCTFCHLLWIALRPYEAAGLQVRWIPVGFLHEDSAAKAAALLKGGEAALTQMQEKFDERTESGGLAGVEITPDLKAKLDANLALMREANVHGTPGLFYKDAAGHVQRKDGMPKLAELPAITGIPAQPESNPSLARFSK
jgi:thiol:disulfide interchange protein DsbG